MTKMKHQTESKFQKNDVNCTVKLQADPQDRRKEAGSYQRNRKEVSQIGRARPDQRTLHLMKISDIAGGKRAILPEELKEVSKYLSEEEVNQTNNHLSAQKIENYWRKCLQGRGYHGQRG